MYDLAVIGAGPVGSYLASLCAPSMDVLVLEEDDQAGGKACSGLVSPRFVNMLPEGVRNSVVQNRVSAAIIHFMGQSFEFRKKGTAAYVIDRNALDKELASHAASKGAEMKYRENVLMIENVKDSVRIKTSRHTFEAHIAAGCDGARSASARAVGFRPAELLNGLIIYSTEHSDSDTVEMWFDKSIVKDGFFWKIPRGDETEYGCIGKNLSFRVLEVFFRLGKADVRRSAAPVPIGPGKSVAGNILLIGDAAAQTKPWSGGGLAYGFIAAEEASEIIARAVRTGDTSKLGLYENAWKRHLMKDINAGMMLREFYKDLDIGALSSVIENAGRINKDDIDFDFPFSSSMLL